jgi:hypothetical protein
MTPIEVMVRPDEATRTANSACVWIAEATVDGRTYVAHSRHGAANALARKLAAAELTDRPMVVRYQGLAGTVTWRSFYAAANWTYSEADQPLRRVRYKERPEGLFSVSGTKQKCVSSAPDDDVAVPPAHGHKTQAPAPTIEMRRCDGCGGDFRPARPWSRFCSPACRLRAHRRLARDAKNPEISHNFRFPIDPRTHPLGRFPRTACRLLPTARACMRVCLVDEGNRYQLTSCNTVGGLSFPLLQVNPVHRRGESSPFQELLAVLGRVASFLSHYRYQPRDSDGIHSVGRHAKRQCRRDRAWLPYCKLETG